jgi:transposase
MLYLAIDQHRKQLTISLRDEEGAVLDRRQVSTEWARVRKYFAGLRDRSAAAGGFVAILEICGFNDWLVKLLAEYGCQETVLVQPEKRHKHKTDHRDANTLGELLWINRHRLLAGERLQNVRRVRLPSDEEAANRQLTELRCKTVDLRTEVINRIHHLLHKHNLHHSCPTKGLQTKAARTWLKELSLSAIDRLEMNQLLDTWELYEKQLAEQEAEIRRRQANHATAQVIATIPGASAYSSLALACRLSDGIERFERGQSLANFWGLTPGCRNSGESRQRIGAITKAGSKLARRLLGNLVLHVLRKDAWMRNWYRAVKARRGSKIARVAVMRRLATTIWQMVKHNVPYCSGGPTAVAKQKALAAALA